MKKFGVFSGFLGAGKTTALIALTEYCSAHGLPAAMISNDLGGSGLADHRFALLNGAKAEEITGNCICYVPDRLTETLDRFFTAGCQLVLSDIPGFGVGALEHVYHGLHENHPGRYALAPFTVLIEPRTVEVLRCGGEEPAYILNTQLREADLIVLNKLDLLSEAERQEAEAFLRAEYPEARFLGISARSGEGLPALAEALAGTEASLRRPDIGYGGEAFHAAMDGVFEYEQQYHVTVCCDSFDGTAYLTALAEAVQQAVRAIPHGLIPHLKLLAWTAEGDWGKVDLLGTDRPPELTRPFSGPCTELAVVLNASAFCPGEALENLMEAAAEQVSAAFQLERAVFRRQLI